MSDESKLDDIKTLVENKGVATKEAENKDTETKEAENKAEVKRIATKQAIIDRFNLTQRFVSMMNKYPRDIVEHALEHMDQHLAERQLDMDSFDDYESYGSAFKRTHDYSGLPMGLCARCEPIYENVLLKELVTKECSECGDLDKYVYACRRHNLVACSDKCAKKLATKHKFSLLHFDGAVVDDKGKIKLTVDIH